MFCPTTPNASLLSQLSPVCQVPFLSLCWVHQVTAHALTRLELPVCTTTDQMTTISGKHKVQDYNLLCNGGIPLTVLSILGHQVFLCLWVLGFSGCLFVFQEIIISIPASHPTIYVENGLKQIEKLSEDKWRNWKTGINSVTTLALLKMRLQINLQRGEFVKSFESFSN